MDRLFLVTRKRTALAAGIALTIALIAQRPGLVQAAAQADPLKFASAAPVILGWQVKADKTKDFEDFWTGLRAALSKTESADMKALADSLTKIYKVNVPPFPDAQGNQIVIYLFHLDPPSTVFSYDPVKVIYTDPNGLRASLENPKIPRKEADDLYNLVKTAVATINPIWPLIKIGG